MSKARVPRREAGEVRHELDEESSSGRLRTTVVETQKNKPRVRMQHLRKQRCLRIFKKQTSQWLFDL